MLMLVLATSGCVSTGSQAESAPGAEEASPIPSVVASEATGASQPAVSTSPSPSPEPAESPARSLLPDEIPLPTSEPGAGGSDALLPDARLGGDPDQNGGCLWLEAPYAAPADGDAGSRLSAIWPHGLRAFRDPLRLVGPDGQVIARVGDILSVGGGFPPVDYVIPPEFDPCGTGQVFAVSEIVSVNGVVVRIGAPPSPQP